MASFEDRITALKNNAGSKNSRSPLNDPFYAESLIIQSKSIVGRMYSSNEYVRFKYECELNQLVKQYRVWLAEIKREEREIGAKLEAMRKEQRAISKERHDLKAIQIVEKTNREFINHYKRRGINKRSDRAVLQLPQKTGSDTFVQEKKRLPKVPQTAESLHYSKGSKLQKALRLPQIVSKLEGVARATNERRTSLPAISSQNVNIKTERDTQKTKREAYENGMFSDASKQPEHVELVQGLIKTQKEKENIPSQSNKPIKHSGYKSTATLVKTSSIEKTKQVKSLDSLREEESSTKALSTIRQPRVLSAPKSRSDNHDVLVMTTRPSSACGIAI